ncbi:unnamed protein product [Prorocentrum cordatum]|uniref:Uncharacterized protein n=1 Tax=Prorocentrum cordatum TaxID=2364126 RepID=A0ABN9U5F5_9DINO|nr:unnamed protein product [Polarella glacialis]
MAVFMEDVMLAIDMLMMHCRGLVAAYMNVGTVVESFLQYLIRVLSTFLAVFVFDWLLVIFVTVFMVLKAVFMKDGMTIIDMQMMRCWFLLVANMTVGTVVQSVHPCLRCVVSIFLTTLVAILMWIFLVSVIFLLAVFLQVRGHRGGFL